MHRGGSNNVERDSINVERYVKEVAIMIYELTMATGRMFEQEHLRMINMVSAISPGGATGSYLAPKGHHGAQGK